MAVEQKAPAPPGTLLRQAAQLVDQALNRLNVTSAPCGSCRTVLYEDLLEQRLFEQLSATPDKLREVAKKLEANEVQRSATGYTRARRLWLERGGGGVSFEQEAYDLLAELAAFGTGEGLKDRAAHLLRLVEGR